MDATKSNRLLYAISEFEIYIVLAHIHPHSCISLLDHLTTRDLHTEFFKTFPGTGLLGFISFLIKVLNTRKPDIKRIRAS